jgi:ERCC4-type nuclease
MIHTAATTRRRKSSLLYQTLHDEGFYACPFRVIVDTREQAPWAFMGIVIRRKLLNVETVRATLPTGDYTVEGQEDRIVIERKSAADYLSSITAGRERFEREHRRMAAIVAEHGLAAVVIEGDLSRMCDEIDADEGRRVTSETVLGTAAAWYERFRVPHLFAGDRRRAELLAFRMLWFWMEDTVDG